MAKMKDILERIRAKKRDKAKRYNLYLTEKTREEFVKYCCDGLPFSTVVEAVMRDRIEEVRKGKP